MSRQDFHGLDGSQLKWIAVLTMLVDHTAFLLLGRGCLPVRMEELQAMTGSATQSALFAALRASYTHWYLVYEIMRGIGRIAFPIYAFLLVEGCFHTRNWHRYALRLGMFALVSEIPFNLMIASRIYSPEAQNVFFTLLLGLLMIKAMDILNGNDPDATGQPSGGSFSRSSGPLSGSGFPFPIRLPQIAVMAVFAILAWYLRTDYDYTGILLIALFYQFRRERWRACLLGFFWMVCLHGSWYSLPGYAVSFLLVWFYNGRRGRQHWKYGFYLFYPLHIVLLYGIYCQIFASTSLH